MTITCPVKNPTKLPLPFFLKTVVIRAVILPCGCVLRGLIGHKIKQLRLLASASSASRASPTRRGQWRTDECPLSGVKRTSLPHRKMSANDSKRTFE